ncbi:hypothetical protein P3T76_011089 [Phytophthora citrophthora]|uniref:Uncharacterized protein n=1 Tax=Phytophthora citrophthora TaxID=4793 RepID=A0AAD9G9W8_9STRA|nr:hypothetical protein P3T76_011089 [Phytophthora citrophthora]
MNLRDLTILLLYVHFLQIFTLQSISTATQSVDVPSHVLEAEISVTKEQLKLYQLKAELLRNAIKRIQSQLHSNSLSNSTESTPASPTTQQRSRYRESPQIFSDWFELHGMFKQPNAVRALTQLISFRPNASPSGRKQQLVARRKMDDDLPLQFLLVLDQVSTVMSLFHLTTHELMWQHSLDLDSTAKTKAVQVADMFFVSDRSAHLAILLMSGDLALFKIRLWHNRRIISGDLRRVKPLKDMEEKYLKCPLGQNSLNALDVSQPPWLQYSKASLTSPAAGKYLHVDVERVFRTTLNREWEYVRGKVVMVSLHYRVLVVATDSSGGHISVFHVDNGSFIRDVNTQSASRDDNIVHLEPIQNSRGLVALATRSRVLFVDTSVSQLVPVVCEAPGQHTFTSLATDLLRPTVFYVGTSTGRALVYKLHNFGSWRKRSDTSESRSPVMCALVDQLVPRRPAPAFSHSMSAVVQTLPGFLVLGAGSRLALYQLSGSSEDVHPTYLSERSLLDSFNPDVNPMILGVSSSKDLIVHSVAFAAVVGDANGSLRVDIYESRIPPPGTNLDLSWIRVPAMMICALAAMFWQQRGRVAGGRGRFSETELAGLLSGREGRTLGMNTMKRSGVSSNRRATSGFKTVYDGKL